MKRLMHFLSLTALVGCLAIASASNLKAGRTGGADGWYGVLPGYQTITYNISFDAGAPAVIVVSGSTLTRLNLVVTDANGKSWTGFGDEIHKVVHFDVVQTGNFTVKIQNLGPAANAFMIRTN
jgi:hypothetical protein